MNLALTHLELSELVEGEVVHNVQGEIAMISYDTRRLETNRSAVFFALKGLNKDGHLYVKDAYEKGVRCFVVSSEIALPKDACIIRVEDTLKALQLLAKKHRQGFSIPVIAITGSFGKTTIKEWLYFLLKDTYCVMRTPKSYNSQLGVALALLEMNETHELAIIEADISHPNEMDCLDEIIAPTIGVFTGLGSHYAENFDSQEHHLAEHLKLFKGVNTTFVLEQYAGKFRRKKLATTNTSVDQWRDYLKGDEQFPENRALTLEIATYFGVSELILQKKVSELPTLSGRQEVFEGINGNLIINDTYNIDIDALEQALDYQFSSNERERKIVVLALDEVNVARKVEIVELVNRYPHHGLFLVEEGKLPEELVQTADTSILFKGSFRSNLNALVLKFKNRKHETWVEFDLKAIQINLRYLQGLLPAGTKTLVMVKASSYGTGDVNIPHFLQEINVDYLGVAYTDEGATLRENGITLPILVMNAESSAFEDILRLQLEPSIYSFQQLEAFINVLRANGILNYPIHLEFETGMNRLGFQLTDIDKLITRIQEEDCLTITSVFSHLSDADNTDRAYTLNQLKQFEEIYHKLTARLPEKIDFHILNSSGVLNYAKEAAFDMVRLGIGLFGYANDHQLKPCISWKTTIAQIQAVDTGAVIGYGKSFKASSPMRIATLRIGYADGFRRSLSNGKGHVYIDNQACPVVGNVCMDMTMVDVSNVSCKEGDEVEIIGINQTMNDFAEQLQTIPYEIMTSINKRVARIYVR